MHVPVTVYETAATKTLLNLQQVMNANFRAKQCSGKSRYGRAVPVRDFFFWAQFSRKLVRIYEYSYLGPVLIMNIHIVHDTKVFVTLREKKAIKYPFPVPSPNPNYNTKS